MLGSLLKKKLSDNQLANVFMNGILEMVENGFGEVAQLINEDPAFITSPNISEEKKRTVFKGCDGSQSFVPGEYV